jgi:hypothetical protein
MLLAVAYLVLRTGILALLGIDASPVAQLIPGLGGNQGILNRVLGIAGIATGVNVDISSSADGANQVATISYDVSRFVNIGEIVTQGAAEAQLEQLLSSGEFANLEVQNISVRYDQGGNDFVITIVAPEETIRELTSGDSPLRTLIETALGEVKLGDLVEGIDG